jgi:hypothetical protein
MGCATVKEKLESKIMMLKLERVDIRTEREERIKQLQELTGEKIERKPIPDYYIHEEDTNYEINKTKKKNSRTKIENKYSPRKSRRIKEESDNESEEESSEDIEVDDDEDNEEENEDENDNDDSEEISTNKRNKRRRK